jgi:hypothetical protein
MPSHRIDRILDVALKDFPEEPGRDLNDRSFVRSAIERVLGDHSVPNVFLHGFSHVAFRGDCVPSVINCDGITGVSFFGPWERAKVPASEFGDSEVERTDADMWILRWGQHSDTIKELTVVSRSGVNSGFLLEKSLSGGVCVRASLLTEKDANSLICCIPVVSRAVAVLFNAWNDLCDAHYIVIVKEMRTLVSDLFSSCFIEADEDEKLRLVDVCTERVSKKYAICDLLKCSDGWGSGMLVDYSFFSQWSDCLCKMLSSDSRYLQRAVNPVMRFPLSDQVSSSVFLWRGFGICPVDGVIPDHVIYSVMTPIVVFYNKDGGIFHVSDRKRDTILEAGNDVERATKFAHLVSVCLAVSHEHTAGRVMSRRTPYLMQRIRRRIAAFEKLAVDEFTVNNITNVEMMTLFVSAGNAVAALTS